jgi:nucleoside-diphosphate-sugar epimerase
MAILVTGTGYIGARMVEDLLARGEEVIGLDNFFATDRKAINALAQGRRFHFVSGSITNVRSLTRAITSRRISTVFILAAQASAHPEAATVDYTERANLVGPRIILDACVAAGIKRVVYASSFRVYGSNLPPVVDEQLPYGRFGDMSHLSKCYVEKLLEMYAANKDMDCLAVRLGVVYGVSPVMKTDPRFITAPNKFCLQAVRSEPITLNSGAERPTGFIHVDDAAHALLDAADDAGLTGYRALNAVSEVRSVAEVADIVAMEAQRKGLPAVNIIGRDDNAQVKRLSEAERPRVISSLRRFSEPTDNTLQSTAGEIIDYFKRIEAKS